MSGGPWEDYAPRQAAPEAGPWLDYAPKVEPGSDAAVGRGILNGVPIIGPTILGGVERVAAGIRSLQGGQPYADELRHVQGFSEATAREHPTAEGGGEMLGGGVGTLPAIIAAPAAFGAGAGGLMARSAASMDTGALIGGADTAARGGDAEQIGKGGTIGFRRGRGSQRRTNKTGLRPMPRSLPIHVEKEIRHKNK